MQYAELHAKTNFSFLQGASHPDELVRRAAELGYAALAITDCNSLAGVVRAHVAAKEAGLRLVIGAEITPEDAPAVVLWATDRAAYGRLARLITCGRRRAQKGDCRLSVHDVAEHAEGLLAGLVAQDALFARDPASLRVTVHGDRHDYGGDGRENGTAALGPQRDRHLFRPERSRKTSQSPARERLPTRKYFSLSRSLRQYREVFGDRLYLLAELHRGPDDGRLLGRLRQAAHRAGVPLAAAGDVHYHLPERKPLHDVLVAIRHGVTVAQAGRYLFANAQRHLRAKEDLRGLFAQAPEALERTLEIAERARFSLDELRYEYPKELAPSGIMPMEYLKRLTWAGARKRYPQGVPPKVRELLEHELHLIEELRYEAYFLTVWDLVRFARGRGILCQGRGSAANSAVCYCLGITAVDPDRMDVLFERFVSRERREAPDIDVDFEHQRREEVLQYVYEKYGRDRAGIAAEVITYRSRLAVRDVGKALGFPAEQIDALAKSIEHFHYEPDLEDRCRQVGIDPSSTQGRQLVSLASELVGFPRHLSQHTGGMVITRGPLCELVPIENAAMPGRTVIQWNKDDLDELGILKVDCLALGMLTAIHKCFDLVNIPGVKKPEHRLPITLATIPEGDRQVYAMIRRADTMGVFQIESRAQMSMLPRLRPRNFYDLVIEVAIVRPGPIQGNMVHPYLRRRNGEEPVTYPSEAVRQVLEKTLGVPLFQEQAMRLAVVAAGFTPGEADQLRRAMGAWRRPGLIDQFHKRLIEGMRERGIPEEYAEAVFQQIRGFGDYGFPESHAASFALLVYVSAWLKCHYPAAFCAAILNSQPMGFYAPAQLVADAGRHGVEVRPVDVNFSRWECTLEVSPASPSGACSVPRRCPPPAVRLGFLMVRGMSSAHAEKIETARAGRPFRSVEEFVRRTGLSRAVTMRLAKAGAFGSLGLARRDALWDALAQDRKELPLFDGLQTQNGPGKQTLRSTAQELGHPAGDSLGVPAPLPPMSPAEEVLADYRTLGLSLQAHPMQFLREGLARLGAVPAQQLKALPDGKPVCVAGIVLVRQRPSTAKGITFVTLEDETGMANLIVRPAIWSRFRQAALTATALLAHGRLERQHEVIHLLATRLEDLSHYLAELAPQSRDFC